MFSGIIEEVGTFGGLSGGNISIGARRVQSDAHIGDSIAVNGICLTVTQFDAHGFRAAVMPETVRRTSLAGLTHGAPLNLERALLPTTFRQRAHRRRGAYSSDARGGQRDPDDRRGR